MGQHGAVPGQAAQVADETGTFNLGAWVSVQRQLHRRGLLSPERAEALEAVDVWSWLPREEGWWAKYEALRDFMVTHGRDPKMAGATGGYEWWQGVNVGQFLNVCRQATGDKGGDWLEQFPDRMAALESIPGWRWSTKDVDWDLSFSRLEKYVAAHGHAARGAASTSSATTWWTASTWAAGCRRCGPGPFAPTARRAYGRCLGGWTPTRASPTRPGIACTCTWRCTCGPTAASPAATTRGLGPTGAPGCSPSGRPSRGGSRPRSNMSADRVRRLEAIPGWWWTREPGLG